MSALTVSTKPLAYHGQKAIKEKYLARVRAHAAYAARKKFFGLAAEKLLQLMAEAPVSSGEGS